MNKLTLGRDDVNGVALKSWEIENTLVIYVTYWLNVIILSNILALQQLDNEVNVEMHGDH